jgi:hypothetical protein
VAVPRVSEHSVRQTVLAAEGACRRELPQHEDDERRDEKGPNSSPLAYSSIGADAAASGTGRPNHRCLGAHRLSLFPTCPNLLWSAWAGPAWGEQLPRLVALIGGLYALVRGLDNIDGHEKWNQLLRSRRG